jgi:hypothetical protein
MNTYLKLFTIAAISIVVSGWVIYLMITNVTFGPEYLQNEPVQNQFFPTELEVHGKQDIDGNPLLIVSSVTEDKAGGFLYYYRLEYTGVNDYLYSWSILNEVLGREMVIDLEPDSIHEFRITHTSPPVLKSGETEFLRKEKLEDDNLKTSVWIKNEGTLEPAPAPLETTFADPVEKNPAPKPTVGVK